MCDKKSIDVFLGSDENYADGAMVTMAGIILNIKKPSITPRFFIFTNAESLFRRFVEMMQDRAEFYFIDPLEDLENLGLNPATRFFYLCCLIPKYTQSDKVILIDADFLCQKDLSELLDINIENSFCAACIDINFPTLGHDSTCFGPDLAARNRDTAYFNAGLMTINVPLWKSENIADKILAFERRKIKMRIFNDQSAMNYLFNGRFVILDPAWNMFSTHINNTQLTEPVNLHYITKKKPWRVFLRNHAAFFAWYELAHHLREVLGRKYPRSCSARFLVILFSKMPYLTRLLPKRAANNFRNAVYFQTLLKYERKKASDPIPLGTEKAAQTAGF